MKTLFSGNQGTVNDNLVNKIETLKTKWNENKQIIIKNNSKQKELLEFTESLSRGYIKNLNIIVDISNLLLEYKKFIEDITSGLEDINKDLEVSGISSSDFVKLKNITSENIDRITKFFNGELPYMQDIFSKRGDIEATTNINTLASTFNDISNKNKRLVDNN